MNHHLLFYLACFLFSNSLKFGNSTNYKGINRHKPHIEDYFVGTIVENSDAVVVSPPLYAIDSDAPELPGLICEYRLHPVDGTDNEIPFFVSILNKKSGKAEILLKPDVILSACNKTEYDFLISAYDCGSGINDEGEIIDQRGSHKSKLHISVKEINQHIPMFPASQYIVEVEGDLSLGQPLVSLDAVDLDCLPHNGDICHYDVLEDNSQLFKVTDRGILVTRKPIKAKKQIVVMNVSVVAIDCGNRKSSPANVLITIKPTCIPGWSGMQKRVEFISTESHSVQIAQNSVFNLCIPEHDIMSVEFTVNLDVSQVGSITGCDRDTYAMKDARKLCDAEEQELLEILPNYPEYNRLMILPDTTQPSLPILKRNVRQHGGRIFQFNGIDEAFDIENDDAFQKLNSLDVTSTFSISFRMFLYANINETHNSKSTIICKSDNYGLSRHHFSVYVQNCHLMLLIRNEHGFKSELSPAEWHWKLDREECHEKWFQILINIDFPNSTLFVNGVRQVPFLIADDYPFHKGKKPTKWVVGAAWEGRTSKFAHHFYGKLSDLVVHLGKLEDVEVLSCVGQCKEGLTVMSSHQVEEKINASSEFDFSVTLSSDGNDLESIAEELKKVAYLNTRHFPAPGERSVKIETRLRCTQNATVCPYVPPLGLYVMVIPPPDPSITLSGRGHMARPVDEVRGHDLYLFDDVSIVSEAKNVNLQLSDEVYSPEHNLDCCIIKEIQSEGRKGKFRIRPKHLLRDYGLTLEKRDLGVAIRGIQKIGVYEEVVNAVTYQNTEADDINDFTFEVSCAELNGRFHSNVYRLVITVLNPSVMLTPAEVPQPNPLVSNHELSPVALMASRYPGDGVHLQEMETSDMIGQRMFKSTGRSHDVSIPTVVIGTCIGIIVLLVIAVVVHAKLRGCNDEQDDGDDHLTGKDQSAPEMEEGELDWDDSAMTITINPMEEAMDAASDLDFSEIDDESASEATDVDEGPHHESRKTMIHATKHDDPYKWYN